VILISIDTLRADHLSCYQRNRPPTPNIDSVARNGTLFSDVSAVVPLTLPSHVTMLTSTYPFANGVQDNGVPFGAGDTLATILKSAGYHTAAFVGGFVLDRRFGLNRGFDVYDSPFDLHKKSVADAGDLKRPGAQVAAAARHWLEQRDTSPFFLFIHLYDLHTPYDLPHGSSPRTGDAGYTAELGYVDGVIGDFLKFLETRGILNNALLLLTADHGEGLGDHGESTHGYFVYQSTLHVPLVIRWPEGSKRAMKPRVDEPASLMDVTPSVLDALDIPRPAAMQGHSLITRSTVTSAYAESLYARDHFGCAPLRVLRSGSYKYIDAPKPELYDLAKDPSEIRNLYGTELPRATAMRRELLALIPAGNGVKPRAPSAEAVAALRSLGYLSGSTQGSRLASRIDPKDRIADFELYGHALALASAGRTAESSQVLAGLAAKLPDLADLEVSLGLNDQREGRHAEAASEFRKALERAPMNSQAHFDLALSQFRLQRLDDAIRELQAALALEPWYTRAEELLATICLEKRELEPAHAHLTHLLAIDPENYTAHYNLGVLAAMHRNWEEAQQHLLSALRTDPTSAEAHDALGGVYLARQDLKQAQNEFEQAIRIQPRLASAHFNLALVFKKQAKLDDAEQEFRAALKADPQFSRARMELDKLKASPEM